MNKKLILFLVLFLMGFSLTDCKVLPSKNSSVYNAAEKTVDMFMGNSIDESIFDNSFVFNLEEFLTSGTSTIEITNGSYTKEQMVTMMADNPWGITDSEHEDFETYTDYYECYLGLLKEVNGTLVASYCFRVTLVDKGGWFIHDWRITELRMYFRYYY